MKICGVTDPKTAAFAAKQGAAFIGLVFEKRSHRYVTWEIAKNIASQTRFFGATPVGVFTTQDGKEINEIVEKVELEAIQLHGRNARAAYHDLPNHLTSLYALHVDPNGAVQEKDLSFLNPNRDFLIYDGMIPGSGQAFDWKNFHPNRNFRFFLAGGLNLDNVELAIKMKHPTAVDVSSGVENPKTKRKDLEQIQLFIQKVLEVG